VVSLDGERVSVKTMDSFRPTHRLVQPSLLWQMQNWVGVNDCLEFWSEVMEDWSREQVVFQLLHGSFAFRHPLPRGGHSATAWRYSSLIRTPVSSKIWPKNSTLRWLNLRFREVDIYLVLAELLQDLTYVFLVVFFCLGVN